MEKHPQRERNVEASVEVRLFGLLRQWCEEHDVPCELSIAVPPEGTSARRVAEEIGLEADSIEGVFVNHTLHPLGWTVMPGDRIAFVPYGTPGPHRFFLGLYEAGIASKSGEQHD